MKKILFLILFTTHLSVAQTVTIPGIESISSTNMLKTVEFLASEKLQGRLSGSPGYYEAAEYMKNEFQKIGLKPAFGNDYYQYFYTEYNEITSAGFTVFDNSGNPRIYELGKDFVCRGFTGSGEIKSEVVFCGYGEALGDYNDYQNTDVRNKIVMFFKQDASFLKQESFGGATLRHRVNLAVKNGAKGIILVSKPNDRNPQKPIGSVMDGDGEFQPNCPVIHIDLQTADEILKEKKYKIKNLQSVIDSTEHPFSFNTGVTAEIEIKAQYEKERKTMNIAGIYEGTDDSLKNEYIVIGAHLDHVGGQAGKIYFPGANDNASGSAGVLEIAKTFAEKGIKTKRSIIFVLFSNEESGLQGAKQFINNPPLPLTPDPQSLTPDPQPLTPKITAMLNMDCIGFGDSIQVGNGKSAPVLWKLADELDEKLDNFMVERTWRGGGADATPFHEKGIPILYFVTTNSYAHLHLPTDLPSTLNPGLYEKIVKLCYAVAYEIANGNYTREPLN